MARVAPGGWDTDRGERLPEPHQTGGYDRVVPSAAGRNMYYLDGLLHRADGPALTWADGTQLWYLRGRLHRDGGPAVTGGPGGDEWWRAGERVEPPKQRRAAEVTAEVEP